MQKQQIDPKIKTKALKMLASGKGATAVARTLNLPRTTVSSWQHRPGATLQDEAPAASMSSAAQVQQEQPAELSTADTCQQAPQALHPAAPPPPAATPARETQAQRPAAAEPQALLIRMNGPLQELRVPARIKALASGAGFHESVVTRSLLVLGLAAAERDPGLLARAPAELRAAGEHAAVGA